MDGELAREAAVQGGVFYRWQALDCGYGPREISQLLRENEWRRVRHGTYTTAATWVSADEAGRHLLVAHAVVGSLDGDVVLTHQTAAAAMGVPLWGVPLDDVHVHRDAGRSSRREAGVVHHLGSLPDDQVTKVNGLWVCIPERTALDVSRVVSFESGVVIVDGLRRETAFDLERCSELLEQQRDWHGSVRASRVVNFSDHRAATVGESRCRVLLARIGLPRPDLQREIRDVDGRLVAITDLYIDLIRTAVEFDGKIKYGRKLYEQSGAIQDVDLGQVVWNEKRREDQVRDLGHEMTRIVWHELDGHDRLVHGRFVRAATRAGVTLVAS
jgi:hypothetical protein